LKLPVRWSRSSLQATFMPVAADNGRLSGHGDRWMPDRIRSWARRTSSIVTLVPLMIGSPF
jgi:hypothetical protein